MLEFTPLLCEENQDPYSKFEWEHETIKITGKDGKILYECPNGEFPKQWTWLARQTVASKYFRESRLNTEDRETSVRTMVQRVVSAITQAGLDQAYFDKEQATRYSNELTTIFLGQYASVNSPVWFNVGIPGLVKPQASACFINSVEDNMESILNLATTGGLIFKEGSGSGANLSNLRGSNEKVRGGGFASGPVSFMTGYDGFAKVILSGGRTRRAARMIILDDNHPDLEKFITCKAEQEKLAELLVLAGLSSDFRDDGGAYDVVKHQTGNNSVRVSNAFMQQVQQVLHYGKNPMWNLTNRVDGAIAKQIPVKDIFRLIAESAHKCGDPGLQFKEHINSMNTCANDGEIKASNPCSEFLWLNNSACNLASINLCKFLSDDGTFDIKTFKHVVRIMLITQDILIDYAGYPDPEIEKNSHIYRPLGLGYSNLGGLLMLLGLPYDNPAGRSVAAAITSLMTSQAYTVSAELAEHKGPFERFSANAEGMEEVLQKHYTMTKKLDKDILGIVPKATKLWQTVIGTAFGKRVGLRNSQVTLLAPCGTIGFMMDCATTGIEPDISLVKTKLLVGGSEIKYVNPHIKKGLVALKYDEPTIIKLLEYVERHEHFTGSSLKSEHLAVFDCANSRERQISVEGHIDMIAAVQPFLSGGISKTYNMPHDTTVVDIERAFLRAWESGIKSITIYRSGSKMSEPMRVREVKTEAVVTPIIKRNHPPDDLPADRHGFTVGGHRGYIHPSIDPKTGELIEIFIRVAKFGTTVGGILDNYATLFSYALQYGIPLEVLVGIMDGSNFPPSGPTSNQKIPMAKSILDYIGKYLRLQYLKNDKPRTDRESIIPVPPDDYEFDLSSEMCPECGALMQRTGTCQKCNNCSYSDGVCG